MRRLITSDLEQPIFRATSVSCAHSSGSIRILTCFDLFMEPIVNALLEMAIKNYVHLCTVALLIVHLCTQIVVVFTGGVYILGFKLNGGREMNIDERIEVLKDISFLANRISEYCDTHDLKEIPDSELKKIQRRLELWESARFMEECA